MPDVMTTMALGRRMFKFQRDWEAPYGGAGENCSPRRCAPGHLIVAAAATGYPYVPRALVAGETRARLSRKFVVFARTSTVRGACARMDGRATGFEARCRRRGRAAECGPNRAADGGPNLETCVESQRSPLRTESSKSRNNSELLSRVTAFQRAVTID